MVGDLLRGRTVRSLTYLLKNYDGVRIYFIAPRGLQMSQDLKDYLRENDVDFEESEDLGKIIPVVDALYMTRIQDEYDQGGESKKIDYSKFHFTSNHLKLLKPNAIIMHPLPRRAEISPEVDHDRRAMYWRQVRNGMWVRVALIAKIFLADREVMSY